MPLPERVEKAIGGSHDTTLDAWKVSGVAETARIDTDKATGTVAIALVYQPSPAQAFRLSNITVKFSAAPTTAGSLTVTKNANSGAAYDTLIESQDPSVDSATSYVFEYGVGALYQSGDSVDIAYANDDNRTYGVEVVAELR